LRGTGGRPMRYEPPAIEDRIEVRAVLGRISGLVQPVWRPVRSEHGLDGTADRG
jgi:hypothetical protein